MSQTTFGTVGGLWLLCLIGTSGLADEPPQPEVTPPAKQVAAKQVAAKQVEAKQAEAKQAETDKKAQTEKKADAPAKQKNKVKAPAGYEDAPEARAVPAAAPRNVANAQIILDPVEVEDAEQLAAGFEKLLAANVNANVANLEKQYLPRFTPLLTAELSFIHRACDLNLEQRKKIKASADQCLRGAVRKYSMAQQGMLRRAGVQRLILDPTDLLHQALAKVLKETLQPEQQAAYDAEMAKREAYRQQVAIENVVAIIDERLVLTSDQRRALTESLEKHWQPAWVQSIEMLMNNTQNLPSIPEQFVVPILNETQKQVWQTTQKQSYSVFGGFGFGQQGGALDDFPLVEIAADAKRKNTE